MEHRRDVSGGDIRACAAGGSRRGPESACGGQGVWAVARDGAEDVAVRCAAGLPATAQTPWPPHADSGPRLEPPAAHARISPPETSLRCSMNLAASATVHEIHSRRWSTFTPPQSPAHAALCGLFLLRRSYVTVRALTALSILEHTTHSC